MEAININQLSKLYHLRSSQLDRQRLLDAALDEAFTEHLETAFTEAGIAGSEEICVRLVQVPLSFNLGQSQSETSQHWSNIIAHHIRMELDKGGANVIRYRSRHHALIAFAEDISRNNLQRCWAWNQIGLANLRMESGLAQAREQLVAALLREPAARFAVLTRLAQSERLLSWFGELSAHDRTRLLDAVFDDAGIERRWRDAQPALAAVVRILPASPLGDSVLTGSRIFRHLLRNAAHAGELVLNPRTWIILVLLELEPMLFQRSDTVVSQAIAVLENLLLPVLAAEFNPAGRDPGKASTQAQPIDPLTTLPGSLDAAQQAPAENSPGISTRAAPETCAKSGPALEQTRDRAEPVSDDTPATDRSDDLQAARLKIDAVNTLAQPVTSEFAGLFLLLPVLAETGVDDEASLIEQIAAEAAFSARPLSWILYQLTTHWVLIPGRDPALRIFCGIDIDVDWPWPADDVATPAETGALAEYASAIEKKVLSILKRGDIDRSSVIEELCHRYAKLVIDDGWLELVFSLDCVDTEIRRAGLDLDPGFVPWLGKVVKIRYE